jgi:CRISPR-associated protein Cas1
MGELLLAASSEQVMLDAWDDIRESALADGDAGPEVERFEAASARNVARLSAALRDGSYQPSPVRHVPISKPLGGVRHLAIPVLEDRIVERAVLSVLDPVVDPLLMPWSYAYRRGLGTDDAIRAVLEARDEGYPWLVRADVLRCFDTIPRWPVVTRLGEVCGDLELVDLVRRLLNRRRVGRNAPRLPRGRGLHQGSPLSPLLANLYLDTFDRRMADQGWQVVRFADDFAIPVRDRPSGERALDAAAEALEALDLELNQGKTEVLPLDHGVDFLGVTLTGSSGAGPHESSHPLETMVYVTHERALLRTRGERLVVEHRGETLLRLNLRRVRQIVLVGSIGMTTPLITQALRRGIEIVLLDAHGQYEGRFTPGSRVKPVVKQRQHDVARKEPRALPLAAQFVAGKVQNMRVLLLRADRRLDEPVCGPAVRRMDALRVSAQQARTRSELMGLEGAATRDYFQQWRQLVGLEWSFERRERRPPPDPVNAMLSFGYTLLAQEGVSAAHLAGLDPDVGLLHTPQAGRTSLALDLIEELRPIIVDSTVLALTRRGALRPTDFTTTPDHGCRMGDDARNIFISAYERAMLRLVTHPSGRRVSYRVSLHLQAKQLAHALLDEDAQYRPLVWK